MNPIVATPQATAATINQGSRGSRGFTGLIHVPDG